MAFGLTGFWSVAAFFAIVLTLWAEARIAWLMNGVIIEPNHTIRNLEGNMCGNERGPGVVFSVRLKPNGTYRIGGLPGGDIVSVEEATFAPVDMESPCFADGLDMARAALGIAPGGVWEGAARCFMQDDLIMVVAWRQA